MEDNKRDFVTSYFAWLSLSEQKKRVNRLENITNEERDKKEDKIEDESEEEM